MVRSADWRLALIPLIILSSILVVVQDQTAARSNNPAALPAEARPTPALTVPRVSRGTSAIGPGIYLPFVDNAVSGTALPTPTPAATVGPQPTPLPTVTGGPNYTFLAPANPVNLTSVTLDSAHQVSLTMPTTGGSLTATAADGTTFQLTIPAGALVEPTTITMTTVLSVVGTPSSLRFVDGVQIDPDGLRLYQLATLTITPASPVVSSYTFASQENGQEVYGYPPTLGTTPFTLGLIHFSAYYVGDGIWINLDNSNPIYSEDELDNIARQIMANPTAPDFQTLMTQLFVVYYNQIIAPALVAIQAGCVPLQQLTPQIIGYEKQVQMFLPADSTLFQPVYDEISQQLTSAMVNCWNQTIAPCVDWTNVVQAQTVVSMARQAAVMGLGSTINLDQIKPCSCTNVSQLTKGWDGTVNYTYGANGQNTALNGTTLSTTIQVSFGVTGTLTTKPAINATFPFPYVASDQTWDNGAQELTGSASFNEVDADVPAQSAGTSFTYTGNGPPVGSIAGDVSFIGLYLSPTTCLYSMIANVSVQTNMIAQPGGSQSSNPIRIASLYVPPQPLPQATQGTTLSGSISIPVYLTYNGYGASPYMDPWVNAFGAGTNYLPEILLANGTPNAGSATVTWSFKPIP